MNFIGGPFGTIDVSIGTDGTISGNLAVSGNLSVTGNLDVAGTSLFQGTVTVTGSIVMTATNNTAVDITRAGGDLMVTVLNSVDASTAGVRFIANVAGGSAGDAYYESIVSGAGRWAFGLDNSDSDSFVIASGSALGTGNVLRLQTSTAGGGITLGVNSASAHIVNCTIAATGTGVLTFLNGPTGVSGNPISYLQITLNGNTVVIPCWDI